VTGVTKVVCENVVAGVVQNPIVGNEINFEIIAAPTPHGFPRFEVSGNARSTEPHWMIGNDDLVGSGGRDEPTLKRHTVQGWKGYVLVVQVLLGG